ncbi:hypothetical protein FIBSPDRAFT_433214 [Athelia psychrophila]|uniref:Uncharacterized protein n=1 Tax=Athelia psychrophila TaxID=1759441 RepID=A0A167UHQ9_9AGAM|nr:hypothetical protein FIBSPDRAFT_433214 [Fibularhizoctonia sp. CBS 109695]
MGQCSISQANITAFEVRRSSNWHTGVTFERRNSEGARNATTRENIAMSCTYRADGGPLSLAFIQHQRKMRFIPVALAIAVAATPAMGGPVTYFMCQVAPPPLRLVPPRRFIGHLHFLRAARA